MTEVRPAILPASHPDTLAAAMSALQAGGIVGLPTDTVYGIGVVPQPAALEALIRAKRRPDEKGIALLIDGLDQIDMLVELSRMARRLAQHLWPGALTLVLPLRRPELVATALTGGRVTLGLRIPDHPLPRALARALGPIAVTSANRGGEPPAQTAAALAASVGHSLALVIDDGPARGGTASTVVAVSRDDRWRILRTGAIDEAAIASAAEGD